MRSNNDSDMFNNIVYYVSLLYIFKFRSRRILLDFKLDYKIFVKLIVFLN